MERIPMDFTELFCAVDDFCREFEPLWRQRQISDGQRRRRRKTRLSLSERMTIVIAFHSSGYRDFKHCYSRDIEQIFQAWSVMPVLCGRCPSSQFRYVPICKQVTANTPALRLWIRPPWQSAATSESGETGCFMASPSWAKTQWVGFSVSSSIW